MLFSKTILFASVTFNGIVSAVSNPTTTADPALSLSQQYNTRSHHEPPCFKGVYIIAVSGIGSGLEHSYGLLSNTVRSIRNAIPRSGNFSVNFPKHSSDFGALTATGQRNLMRHIELYSKRCPHTPLVLLGYSAGAVITSNSLCGRSDGTPPSRLPLKYKKNIIAAITMGDESFVPHQAWNRGTCKTGQGVVSRSNSDHCKPWGLKFQTFCDKGDDECCYGEEAGHDAHHTYTDRYDHRITKFVVQRYKARKHTR